jgi:hypothetical protein
VVVVMRPLDDALGPDELLPDLLAGTRDALDAIDGALTNNIRPLTGAAAMSEPRRIQRKRTKGWKMPEGAIYVGRPTRWGNPFRAIREGGFQCVVDHRGARWSRLVCDTDRAKCATEMRAEAVRLFELHSGPMGNYEIDADDLAALRGHDLACWCPLDQPCHADVLLELANAKESA